MLPFQSESEEKNNIPPPAQNRYMQENNLEELIHFILLFGSRRRLKQEWVSERLCEPKLWQKQSVPSS